MNRFRHLTLPLLLGSLVCSGYILPKDRRYADYLLKLEVAAISRMHAFRLVSSSAQVGQERLEKIDLRFSHHRILSQEEARALVVEVAEYLVKRMNSDTALKEKGFLSSPFDLHQLHLEIEMDNLISMNIDTLTIQRVILDNRSITYQTFKGSNLLYSRSSTFHETFQDALISLGRETTFDPSLDSENDRAIIEQDLGSDALYEKSALFTFSALELQEEPKTAESALSPSANEASEEDSVIHAIEASISPASGISSEEEDSPITNFGVESEPLQDSEELGSSLQPIITSVDTSSEQLSSQTNTEEAYHAQIEERIDAQLLDEEKKPDIAPTAEYGIIDDPSVAEEIDHEALIEEPQSPSFFTKIWQKLFREPISTSEPESEEKPVKDEVTTDEVSLETLEHNIPAQYTIAAVQHEELQSPSFFAKAWNTLFGEPEEVIVEETTSPSELKAIAAVVEDEISKADAILLSLEHEIAVQKKIEEEMAEESKTSPIDPELVIQDPLQEDIDIAEEDVDLLEKNRAESPSFFTKIWNKIFGEPEEVIVVQEIVKEPVSPTELESDKTAQSDELFSVTLEDSPKIIPDEAPQSPSFFSKVWNKVVGEPVSIDKIESDRADAIFAPLENESPAEALEASDAIIIQNGPETIQDEELQSPSFFTKVWNKVFGEPKVVVHEELLSINQPEEREAIAEAEIAQSDAPLLIVVDNQEAIQTLQNDGSQPPSFFTNVWHKVFGEPKILEIEEVFESPISINQLELKEMPSQNEPLDFEEPAVQEPRSSLIALEDEGLKAAEMVEPPQNDEAQLPSFFTKVWSTLFGESVQDHVTESSSLEEPSQTEEEASV